MTTDNTSIEMRVTMETRYTDLKGAIVASMIADEDEAITTLAYAGTDLATIQAKNPCVAMHIAMHTAESLYALALMRAMGEIEIDDLREVQPQYVKDARIVAFPLLATDALLNGIPTAAERNGQTRLFDDPLPFRESARHSERFAARRQYVATEGS